MNRKLRSGRGLPRRALVERHDGAAFLQSKCQYLVVSRIDGPVANPEHVMSMCGELSYSSKPNAGVEQQPHAASMALEEELDARIPVVAGRILPITALSASYSRKRGHSLHAHDVLRLLIAKLSLDAQPQRGAVTDG